jgi:hypothetical protein
MMRLIILVIFAMLCLKAEAFSSRRIMWAARSTRLGLNMGSLQPYGEDVVVEIAAKSTIKTTEGLDRAQERSEYVGVVAAYDEVYEEEKEDRMFQLVESPALKVLSVLLNPSTMVLVLYLTSVGWSKVIWLQKFFKIFGKGTLVKKPGDTAGQAVEELPFQTFECEVCKMEMRPARGRAEAIFGRPRFRCSRCGAKASSYFDVDDMSDPRAVARLERLDKEKNEEWTDDDDDDEYEDDDDDDEEE